MLTLEEMTLAIDGAKARIKNEKRKRRTSKKLKEVSTISAEKSVGEEVRISFKIRLIVCLKKIWKKSIVL